jgi:hypothetical protein
MRREWHLAAFRPRYEPEPVDPKGRFRNWRNFRMREASLPRRDAAILFFASYKRLPVES